MTELEDIEVDNFTLVRYTIPLLIICEIIHITYYNHWLDSVHNQLILIFYIQYAVISGTVSRLWHILPGRSSWAFLRASVYPSITSVTDKP